MAGRTDSDAALVRSLGGSDGESALRALYSSHADDLYGFAVARLGDPGLAEELVQDVFLRAWRGADGYDPARSSVRTWLFAIARNASIDLDRRRRSRLPLARECAPREEHADAIEVALLRWQIRGALDQLTSEHREIIRLAHFRGLHIGEIAARTGLPVGTVKSRLFYALRSLRLALEEAGVDP
ncbi:MAG: sigma-70 family RNA polymerase sigma factor [Actinobacteria bacterium]|nr:sigma-70 family RNA polymerase sigma factor [Actinomycetota bacterium]